MSRTSSAAPPSAGPISYRQQYRRCGKAGCTRCAHGLGHGPYWYAYWWEEGQPRSRYLGKQPPAGIAADPVPGHDTPGCAPAVVPAPASAPSSVAPLRVQTLGGFAVWRGAVPLPPTAWTSQRAATLFKCLLSVPGYRLPREQASELLWPEGEPAAGASNLRTTVHLLRQVLDAPQAGRTGSYLRTQGAVIALAPAGAVEAPDDWLDALAFARAAQGALAGQDVAACRAALALYGGDYLPDEPYADWAAPLRTSLRRQYLGLLLHLAALSGARGALAEAEECLRRVLTTEPGHEEAAATLMSLLAESGRRGEALRVYQALATALEQELEVAPSADVAVLRARLLAQDAAPLASARAPARPAQPGHSTNLPLALTSFVGRRWEITAVTDLLATTRLVTLTGPGGCGKTRLALAVTERLVEADAYPDGMWLVELAALADPTLVPRAVAAVLGVTEQPGQPLSATLAAFLRARRLLLVLDNCEHLLGACAELATHLLTASSHLRLLATSREGLGVAGEQTYLVPALAAPDPRALPPLAQVAAYEAVTLFVERARARRPEFALTTANAVTVSQICARLDGLPLAIELAAARVGVLPVETIATRLDDRFGLLTGGPRTALPRQQTLRATLDWSHELLSMPEQVLLQRLAVFAGGWTLAAAEAICADIALAAGVGSNASELESATPYSNARLPTSAVLDLLTALVHKSLVVVAEREGEGRYGLLETIRTFELERLSAGGERELVQRQHALYYLALAEVAEAELRGPAQVAWLARLEREHDNLRAALRETREGGDLEIGLRLAGALWRFWWVRGYLSEGRVWLDELLARSSDASAAPMRAKALQGAGILAWSQGDNQTAAHLYEASEMLYRQLGDTRSLVGVLLMRGWVCDAAQRAALAEESVALSRETAYKHGLADALATLGIVARGAGDLRRARSLGEESLALARELGDVHRMAAVLLNLGEVAFEQGANRRAGELLDESLRLWREQGSKGGTAHALDLLAQVRHAQGDHTRAAALLQESLALWQDQGARTGAAHTLDLLRRVEQVQGRSSDDRTERDR